MLHNIPEGIFVFEIDGPLFFGTAQKFEVATSRLGIDYKVLVLRLQNMSYLDAGGLHVLEQLYDTCKSRNITLLISEIRIQPYILLLKSKLLDKIGKDNLPGSMQETLERGKEIIAQGKNKE